MKLTILFPYIAALLAGACAIPKVDRLDLSGCIKGCNLTNSACLSAREFKCPAGSACFDKVQLCFDDSTACSDGCIGCKEAGTCTSEGVCTKPCLHKANKCTNIIRACVDLERGCAGAQVKFTGVCVDVMGDCVAGCIKEAETALKGK